MIRAIVLGFQGEALGPRYDLFKFGEGIVRL